MWTTPSFAFEQTAMVFRSSSVWGICSGIVTAKISRGSISGSKIIAAPDQLLGKKRARQASIDPASAKSLPVRRLKRIPPHISIRRSRQKQQLLFEIEQSPGVRAIMRGPSNQAEKMRRTRDYSISTTGFL